MKQPERCRDSTSLLDHEWSNVVRVCLDCELHTTPEAIEQAARDARLRNDALDEAIAAATAPRATLWGIADELRRLKRDMGAP